MDMDVLSYESLEQRVIDQKESRENMEGALETARQWFTAVDDVRVRARDVPAFDPELRSRMEQLDEQFARLIDLFDNERYKRPPGTSRICRLHGQRSDSEFSEREKQMAYVAIDRHLDEDVDLERTRRMLCAAHEELWKLLCE